MILRMSLHHLSSGSARPTRRRVVRQPRAPRDGPGSPGPGQRSRPSLTASRRKATTSARTASPSRSSRPAMAAAAAAAVEVAVAHRGERRGDRRQGEVAAQPSALAQHDRGGVERARHRVPLLVDVGCAPPGDVEHVVVVVLGEPGAGVEPGEHGRAHRAPPPATTRPSGRRTGARSTRGRCRVTTPKPIASTSRTSKSSSQAAYIALKSTVPGWWPPSRAQVSAYSAGSCTSRCTTQASSPVPSSQAPTRSVHVEPRGTSQLPRNCAMPPGSRWSPTARTRSRTTASPAAPPSRYSKQRHGARTAG